MGPFATHNHPARNDLIQVILQNFFGYQGTRIVIMNRVAASVAPIIFYALRLLRPR